MMFFKVEEKLVTPIDFLLFSGYSPHSAFSFPPRSIWHTAYFDSACCVYLHNEYYHISIKMWFQWILINNKYLLLLQFNSSNAILRALHSISSYFLTLFSFYTNSHLPHFIFFIYSLERILSTMCLE